VLDFLFHPTIFKDLSNPVGKGITSGKEEELSQARQLSFVKPHLIMFLM